jgi:hypothetical protein
MVMRYKAAIDDVRAALAKPAADSEAAEWLMQRCEEYQQRAHTAERDLLRLRAEQEARKSRPSESHAWPLQRRGSDEPSDLVRAEHFGI